MIIWILLALLTLGLVMLLLAPLGRPVPDSALAAGQDIAVYRDQLAELERDAAAGLIGQSEAEAARAELSRRILAAAGAPAAAPGESPARRRRVAIATIILLPLLALAIYAVEGRPWLPGIPQAERLAQAEANGDFDALVLKVKKHLEQNPSDLRGWLVLIQALSSQNRYAEAAEAWAGFIKVAPASAETLSGYGEALVLANGGKLDARSEAAFAEALKIDPAHPKSRFFMALALRQQGKTDEAIAQWQKLLDEAPADAPWKQAVASAIEQAKAPAPAVDASMIRAMVDGLEARLAENGNDIEGWLKLARSRKVLGEMDKAKAALDAAEAQFKDDAQAMARIAAARAELEKTP